MIILIFPSLEQIQEIAKGRCISKQTSTRMVVVSCLKNSSDVILFEEKKSKVVKSVLF